VSEIMSHLAGAVKSRVARRQSRRTWALHGAVCPGSHVAWAAEAVSRLLKPHGAADSRDSGQDSHRSSRCVWPPLVGTDGDGLEIKLLTNL
jgi:hypothetical protein